MLGVLAGVAEFELDLRRERQREGIEKAKAAAYTKDASRPSTTASVGAMGMFGTGVFITMIYSRILEVAPRLQGA